MNEVEAVARALARANRIEICDSAQYAYSSFREPALAAIAALDAARGDAEPVAWMPIETAPKDGTAFQAIIPGHGADNVLCWTDGLIGSDGRDCGSWVFASDQEPPDCWTDGYCWEVNEDGVPSVQPTHWAEIEGPQPC